MSKVGGKIILRSSDGDEFEVEKKAAMVSRTLKKMAEVSCLDGVIPLANVNSKTLTKILEYCNKYASVKSFHEWNTGFVKGADLGELRELIMAADFLDIEPLLVVTGRAIADHIKCMTAKQVRSIFG